MGPNLTSKFVAAWRLVELDRAGRASEVHSETEYRPFNLQRDEERKEEEILRSLIALSKSRVF